MIAFVAALCPPWLVRKRVAVYEVGGLHRAERRLAHSEGEPQGPALNAHDAGYAVDKMLAAEMTLRKGEVVWDLNGRASLDWEKYPYEKTKYIRSEPAKK